MQTTVDAQPATAATVIGTKKAHKAINIRAEKSLDADIICKVPVGGTLDVIAEADADGWCQVSYETSTGTYNGYMREEHVDTDNTDATNLTGVVKTKTKYINIRQEHRLRCSVQSARRQERVHHRCAGRRGLVPGQL